VKAMAEPYFARQWDVFAEVAGELLAARVADYPGVVAAGGLTQQEADAGIRIMDAIAADWRRIEALYAGREAAPRNQTASPAEKLATLVEAVERRRRKTTIAGEDLLAALPAEIREYVLTERMGREDLREMRRLGSPFAAPIGIYLKSERRLFILEAMLWHAHQSPSAMFYAELTVEWRGVGTRAEAA